MSSGIRRIVGIALVLAAGFVGSGAAQDDVEEASSEPRWVPPGTEGYPPELDRRLSEALEARGDGYRPRTHHFRDDGAPRYTNRLIFESSPYLLQHAHNPVDWYPWGDEAFETARRLGRPVLLSIGYSTCHWCHVMEEESFEDEEIAAYLNEHYIAIKVDREERPDLDDIYMTAVQLLTGRGGWPMTTWLTPDRLPFYGGTYYPARDGDRGRSTGFLTLLKRLREIYDQDPDKVASQATTIRDRILARQGATAGDLPSIKAIEMAVAGYSRAFDAEHGGIGRAPKFPSSLPIRLLLRHYRRSGDAEALDMALLTLDKMAAGGMYDQVGGGFHRYSTDRRWLVPHFEKMLYDNALLAVAYLDAFQVTGEERFAVVVRDVLDYVAREMTSPSGGFYSATDADSLAPNGEREEGWFFTWTPDELRAELGDARARAFIAYYGVTDEGDYEGRNILHVTRSLDEVAASLEISSAELDRELEASREILYRTRASRPPPLRDDKVLVSWNGLMVSAFAQAGFVLRRDDYVKRAEDAAGFLLEHLVIDGRLRRSYNEGRARHNAYLDDYAFLIAGLLDLYEITHRLSWLERAIALQATLDEHYLDTKDGGYFLTSDDHEELLSRDKPTYDGAEPSGNALALMNLLRLYELTTNAAYLSTAESTLKAFGRTIASSPRGVSEMLLALDFYLDRSKEIVLVTRGSSGAEPFLEVLRQTYAPNKVVIVVREGKELKQQSAVIPLVTGKVARGGRSTAYVCEQGVCKLPTTDPQEFARQLIGPAADSMESRVESGER